MTVQPSHWPLFQKRLDWCAESGKRTGFPDCGWEWSFYWICAGISRSCGISPSDSSYKNRNKRTGCVSANRQSIWLAQLDGLTLFRFRTKAMEDILAKWAFIKSTKLYQERPLGSLILSFLGKEVVEVEGSALGVNLCTSVTFRRWSLGEGVFPSPPHHPPHTHTHQFFTFH